MDEHGNTIALEGNDRCVCGCKYWEHDRCIDCGAKPPTTIERLGYTPTDIGVQCNACGQEYAAHRNAFVVEGSVMRSHRRNCPTAPEAVPVPGVCDA